jgi:hypothetical protein
MQRAATVRIEDPEGRTPESESSRANPSDRIPPPHSAILASEQRRRREVAFLARELYNQAQALLSAVGDLVPAELAAGTGDLEACPPLRTVAQKLDDTLTCFDLLQEELGLPTGREPRYRPGNPGPL